uniref:Uncharacterized protein n=1 Tax=Anguilla anguilla TaxID=7936 RepID=A0A0E9P737_ANGAN
MSFSFLLFKQKLFFLSKVQNSHASAFLQECSGQVAVP